MHLHCNLGHCGWISSHSDVLGILIGEYLYHAITEHWDVLVYAHENPDKLREAYSIIETGEPC